MMHCLLVEQCTHGAVATLASDDVPCQEPRRPRPVFTRSTISQLGLFGLATGTVVSLPSAPTLLLRGGDKASRFRWWRWQRTRTGSQPSVQKNSIWWNRRDVCEKRKLVWWENGDWRVSWNETSATIYSRKRSKIQLGSCPSSYICWIGEASAIPIGRYYLSTRGWWIDSLTRAACYN
jgi:hypothetical protein